MFVVSSLDCDWKLGLGGRALCFRPRRVLAVLFVSEGLWGSFVFEIDSVQKMIEISCEFSMNAFVDVQSPTMTVAIRNKAGKL